MKTEDVIITPWQAFAILHPYEHMAFYGGVAAGKTFTESHFALHHLEHYPEFTGFIGANTHDQLSQVTLREFFHWLDFYGWEWVSDCRPPLSWNTKKQFKKYDNVLSVRNMKPVIMGSYEYEATVSHIFTRVLSAGFRLRGLEFSWYTIDETRDTPQDTHDVILGRMRESHYRKGLVGSTTNGEDWSWERFVRDADGARYGAIHIPTTESVRFGIVTQEFYDTLKKTYHKALADQELDALHVVVTDLPAYYAYSKENETPLSPFTKDGKISPYLPIVVAPDFNLSPMCWTLGQERAGEMYWHGEIVLERSHTQEATRELIQRVCGHGPGVIIAGDATAKAGQRAAAGQSDYDIVLKGLTEAGIKWTNRTPDSNPPVKDRINNVNARLRGADGKVHMWHHPDCKNLKRDFQRVSWKKGAEFTLDPGSKRDLTHSSDGVGYAVSVLSPIPSSFQVGGLRVIRR